MANLLTTDTELTQVANAIRDVTGGSSQLSYPAGFSSALSSVTRQAATTYNTSTSDQTITARKLITGTQTIKGVYTNNIDAGNIKKGVVVKVGDANNNGRIKNVTGTFTGDANAAAGDIRNGKTAYVNGSKVTGNWSPYVTTDTETSHDVYQAGFGSSGATVLEGGFAMLLETIAFPSGYDMISSMSITGSSNITNSGYLKIACAVTMGTVYIFGCNVGSSSIKSTASDWSYSGKVTFRKLKAV